SERSGSTGHQSARQCRRSALNNRVVGRDGIIGEAKRITQDFARIIALVVTEGVIHQLPEGIDGEAGKSRYALDHRRRAFAETLQDTTYVDRTAAATIGARAMAFVRNGPVDAEIVALGVIAPAAFRPERIAALIEHAGPRGFGRFAGRRLFAFAALKA